ncbi:MAG: GDP-fucose synthetase [Candidatus Melainabacteria bacterium]|nr:MAG: GDP-fucose synthetase [Candidatus Melainabacteria bacterium]
MKKDEKIYLAGHKGLVGGAIYRRLQKEGFTNIVTRTFEELDLCNQSAVNEFFEKEKPDYVILAAAKVGGIMANSTYPAEFIYQNIMIAANVIHASYKNGVKKLLNLGSSCIYPRLAPQPMKEDCLLTSELEKTNEAYALAKISAIKLCRYYNQQYGTNFISVMPTNQYGIGDNFNMETAHLLPMILRRFHLAKLLRNGDIESIKKDLKRYKLGWGLDEKLTDDNVEEILAQIGAYKDKVVLWGDGSVYREMMCSDDLADACFYLMQNKDYDEIGELVNITKGDDIQLKDLFQIVKDIVGFEGDIVYDKTKPNGTPRKMMDATKIKALGWTPKIELKQGIKDFYDWYLSL